MENSMYKVAIIGCGDMGGKHAAAWQLRSDAEIVALFDPDQERCQALAAITGAVPCDTLEEALGDFGVDVVSVCTPVCFHAGISCLAVEKGCHVLCEKPIALTAAQADLMVDTAAKHKRKLAVSYQYRGFPKYLKYREIYQSGRFGGPIFARFVDVREVRPKTAMHRQSANGGPLIDMAGHFFDGMSFITGATPQRVYARGHVFGAGKKRLAGIQDLALDAAEIIVDYSGGHILSAFVNWGMPEEFAVIGQEELTGPEGVVCLAGEQVDAIFSDGVESYPLDERPVGPSVRIADLLHAIETDSEPEVSGAIGRRALQVCLRVIESIKSGRPVELVC